MKKKNIKNNICPRCGSTYSGIPALSRADNKTPICSDCGTREALESIGASVGEQDRILKVIHRCESAVKADKRTL